MSLIDEWKKRKKSKPIQQKKKKTIKKKINFNIIKAVKSDIHASRLKEEKVLDMKLKKAKQSQNIEKKRSKLAKFRARKKPKYSGYDIQGGYVTSVY